MFLDHFCFVRHKCMFTLLHVVLLLGHPRMQHSLHFVGVMCSGSCQRTPTRMSDPCTFVVHVAYGTFREVDSIFSLTNEMAVTSREAHFDRCCTREVKRSLGPVKRETAVSLRKSALPLLFSFFFLSVMPCLVHGPVQHDLSTLLPTAWRSGSFPITGTPFAAMPYFQS